MENSIMELAWFVEQNVVVWLELFLFVTWKFFGYLYVCVSVCVYIVMALDFIAVDLFHVFSIVLFLFLEIFSECS